MSKRTKLFSNDNDLSLQDLSPEILDLIGSFPSTGSTRRRLSKSNKYFNGLLRDTRRSQWIQELKETLLNYYDSKEFAVSAEDDKDIVVDVQGKFMTIRPYVHPTEGTNGFIVELGVPVLKQEIAEVNMYTPLTLRPLGELPEVVRTIMAFVFHTYYTSTVPLPPILEISFSFFQDNDFAGLRLTWTTFKTFIENNTYDTILTALTEKHKSLRYLYELPIQVKASCNVEYYDLYKNEIEPFKKENDVVMRSRMVPPLGGLLNFDFKFIRPSKTVRCECFADLNNNIIFTVIYKISKEYMTDDSIGYENISTMTDEILKTIHMLLPNCIDILQKEYFRSILVCLKLRISSDRFIELPYFFTMKNKSYLCKETYVNLYPYVESCLIEFPKIVKNNSFYTFLIHDDLTIEVKNGSYYHFETLPQYSNQ